MLSIQTSPKSAKCNILPCRIKHTGPTEATEKHWVVVEGDDGTKAASFRGRKLVGKSIPVPEGYHGHVLEVTDEKLPSEERLAPSNGQEDGTEEEEKINIFKGLSTFDEITIWGHDATPDESTDGVIRGIEEWIGFASKIHGFPVDDEAQKSQ